MVQYIFEISTKKIHDSREKDYGMSKYTGTSGTLWRNFYFCVEVSNRVANILKLTYSYPLK